MKIKEVQAGVKITNNYNSYSVSLAADLEDNENPEKIGEILIEKANAIINKKIIESSEGNNLKEVGAAWFSRDSEDKLSVQYLKDGKFEDVLIKDLEKTKDGFRQEINNEIFAFKRIPDEKRKNNKMPVFRVYKEDENE